jgi:MFS family permease
MVLTFPGRTQGLGLFTEPLLNSLSLDRESYGFLNLWATLVGALFCLPCGWLLDRLGTKAVLLGVTLGLGATVVAMSQLTGGAWAYHLSLSLPQSMGGQVNLVFMVDLFLFLVLTRGFGQSALSVVSLALIGRAAGRKAGPAMGVFAVATALGFMAAFAILGRFIPSNFGVATALGPPGAFAIRSITANAWRAPWAGIGIVVLILGPMGALLVRNSALEADPARKDTSSHDEGSFTLVQALCSPAFWTFTIATSFLGMVLAGTSLFSESLIAERGLTVSTLAGYWFSEKVYANVMFVGIPFGLAANLTFGWLATRWPLARLMAAATALFGAALLAFPLVTTEGQVYAYAIALAIAGGGMTVCFYTVYRRAFGPARLGSIQGLAQMMTVIFSAVGPQVFASTQTRLGSYSLLFPYFAAFAFALAVTTWLVGLPRRPFPVSEAEADTIVDNGEST